jgi:hypothetical protein
VWLYVSNATTVVVLASLVARVSPWSKQLMVGLTSPGTHVSSSVLLWARLDFVNATAGTLVLPIV